MIKKYIEMYHKSPRKSVRQTSCYVGISKSSIQRILKGFQWKSHISRLAHDINNDNP